MTTATPAVVEWLKTNRAALEGVMAGLPHPTAYDSLVIIAETQSQYIDRDPLADLEAAIHAYHRETGRDPNEWILIVEQTPAGGDADIVMTSSTDLPAHVVGILTVAAAHVEHSGGVS